MHLFMVVTVSMMMLMFQNCAPNNMEFSENIDQAVLLPPQVCQYPDKCAGTGEDKEDEEYLVDECVDYQRQVKSLEVQDEYTVKYGKYYDQTLECGRVIKISSDEGTVRIVMYKRNHL
jgi:hypothetical protein